VPHACWIALIVASGASWMLRRSLKTRPPEASTGSW
jgi:hypothetical protein